MDLKDATAIVTGGASGIGAEVVRSLAARGARCVVVDRDEAGAEAMAKEVDGLAVIADVTDTTAIAAAVTAAAELGPLRALATCAGVGSQARTVDRQGVPMPMEEFERVLRVNLLGTFNVLRLVAAAMADSEPLDDGARGAIVTLASIAAFEGQIGQVAYSASKAGIVGMTLPLARDLAPLGIRVNTVAPGLIDTPIYGTGPAAEEMKAKLGANVIFPRRLGRARELASMVVELLTNDYANGETVRLDGAARLPAR